MSDHEPLDPTRVDTDAVGDATTVQPAVGEPPLPPGPPEGGPPTPGDDRDRNMKLAIGALVGLILVLLGVLLFTSSDDDPEVDANGPTTTEGSTTSSSEDTTTTTEATTTSSTESTTPDPTECSGTNAPPNDPSPVAKEFMNAWQTNDRPCAEAIASASAVNTMFATAPGPTPQTFIGCRSVDDGTGDPHQDCTFSFEGGVTHVKMNLGAIDGWRVFEVQFVAD